MAHRRGHGNPSDSGLSTGPVDYRSFFPGSEAWMQLPDRWRATLVNSASGFKPLVLIATSNNNKLINLALFSQVVHLGANPPFLGVVFRPDSVARHTLENLRSTGRGTVNAVRYDDRVRAHQTSARYPADVSEFDAAGWQRFFRPDWPVPFVEDAPVQWAVRLHSELPIEANGTILAVLEVLQMHVNSEGLDTDGYVDLAQLGVGTVNGLDAYHAVHEKDRLPYAKP